MSQRKIKRIISKINNIKERFLCSQVLSELEYFLNESTEKIKFSHSTISELTHQTSYFEDSFYFKYVSEYKITARELHYNMQQINVKVHRLQDKDPAQHLVYIEQLINLIKNVNEKQKKLRETIQHKELKYTLIEQEIETLRKKYDLRGDFISQSDIDQLQTIDKRIIFFGNLKKHLEEIIIKINELAQLSSLLYNQEPKEIATRKSFEQKQELITPLFKETLLLKNALNKNDQSTIGQHLTNIIKLTNEENYQPIGAYNHKVCSNIFQYNTDNLYEKRSFFSNRKDQNKELNPKQYANRLAKILTLGLRTSGRGLRDSIGGIRNIQTVFFYFGSRFYDKETVAYIEWIPSGFFCFKYTHGIQGVDEGLIFCNHKYFKPTYLKIVIKDPNKAPNQTLFRYIEELIKELNNLKVPFEIM